MLDAATRADLRQRIDAARRALVAPPPCLYGDAPLKGTNFGYTRGCRCCDCRDGHAAYKRSWRARQTTLRPARARTPSARNHAQTGPDTATTSPAA